jgi:hypothetical protein
MTCPRQLLSPKQTFWKCICLLATLTTLESVAIVWNRESWAVNAVCVISLFRCLTRVPRTSTPPTRSSSFQGSRIRAYHSTTIAAALYLPLPSSVQDIKGHGHLVSVSGAFNSLVRQ